MTQLDTERISRLLKLANIAQEFEFIDLKLSDHFCLLREEHGLAKLLLLIQEHSQNKNNQRFALVQNLLTHLKLHYPSMKGLDEIDKLINVPTDFENKVRTHSPQTEMSNQNPNVVQ